jgi:hypothetical protein
MNGATCACGAVGRILPENGPDHGRVPRMEWRGGRIGLDRVAVEDARAGVTACPACQHRSCVFMLVQRARRERRERTGS